MSPAAAPKPHTLNAVHGVRAMAALAVALLHLYAIEMMAPDSILPGAMEYMRLGTDLFFVVSGAVLAYAAEKRTHEPTQAVSFLYDRFSRVLPLYWIVTAALLLVWTFSSHHLLAHVVKNPDLWSTVFLLPTNHDPAIPVAWSLTNLFFFYWVFALTLALPRRHEPAILASWAGFVVVLGLLGLTTSPSPLLRLLAHPSALEFIGGVAIMRLAMSGQRLSPGFLAVASAVWLGVLALVLGPNPGEAPFIEQWFRIALFGPVSLLIVATAIHFDMRKSRRPSQVMRFFGDISFSLYLSHVIAFATVGHFWRVIKIPGPWDNLAGIVVMLAVAIVQAWFLHRFVELPLRRWTHRVKPEVAAWARAQLQRRTSPGV